jgi:predicted metalloprotease with PDZ domain
VSKHSATGLVLTGLLLGLPLAAAQSPDRQGLSKLKSAIGIAFEETGPRAAHKGLVIREVLPDMAAAKAGLKEGDIITKVGKERTDTYKSLLNVMATHEPGEKLTFHIVRDGNEQEVPVTLGPPYKTEGPSNLKGPRQKAGGKPAAFLGVRAASVDELPEGFRQRYKLQANEGLVVVEVAPDSPASRAGLKEGDLLLSVNGKHVTSAAALRRAVREAGIGKEVRLGLKRGQEKMQLTVRLGETTAADWSLLPPLGPTEAQAMPPALRQAVRALVGEYLDAANHRATTPAVSEMTDLQRRVRDLERRVHELEKARKGELPR